MVMMITTVQYIGPQFLSAIRPSLASDWSPEMERAWTLLLRYMGDTMKESMLEARQASALAPTTPVPSPASPERGVPFSPAATDWDLTDWHPCALATSKRFTYVFCKCTLASLNVDKMFLWSACDHLLSCSELFVQRRAKFRLAVARLFRNYTFPLTTNLSTRSSSKFRTNTE